MIAIFIYDDSDDRAVQLADGGSESPHDGVLRIAVFARDEDESTECDDITCINIIESGLSILEAD